MQLAMSIATDQTAQLINTLWEHCQCLYCRMTRRLKGRDIDWESAVTVTHGYLY